MSFPFRLAPAFDFQDATEADGVVGVEDFAVSRQTMKLHKHLRRFGRVAVAHALKDRIGPGRKRPPWKSRGSAPTTDPSGRPASSAPGPPPRARPSPETARSKPLQSKSAD